MNPKVYCWLANYCQEFQICVIEPMLKNAEYSKVMATDSLLKKLKINYKIF
jgi:hypothetical protein